MCSHELHSCFPHWWLWSWVITNCIHLCVSANCSHVVDSFTCIHGLHPGFTYCNSHTAKATWSWFVANYIYLCVCTSHIHFFHMSMYVYVHSRNISIFEPLNHMHASSMCMHQPSPCFPTSVCIHELNSCCSYCNSSLNAVSMHFGQSSARGIGRKFWNSIFQHETLTFVVLLTNICTRRHAPRYKH